MDELEFYDGAWTGQEIDAGIGLTGTLANALAVVVDGNKAAISATVGQYVLVKNSTITGISDGLYKAAKALPANTTLDGTYFSQAVTAGGLNSLKAAITDEINNAVVPTLKRIYLTSSTQDSETLAKNYFLNTMGLGLQYVLTYATDRTTSWLMLKSLNGFGAMIRFYFDGAPGIGSVAYYTYSASSWQGPKYFTMS